jgi:hypothetical protein
MPAPSPGNSVCVFVHGFEPYFFCECPSHWVPEHYEELLQALRVRGVGVIAGRVRLRRAHGRVAATRDVWQGLGVWLQQAQQGQKEVSPERAREAIRARPVASKQQSRGAAARRGGRRRQADRPPCSSLATRRRAPACRRTRA